MIYENNNDIQLLYVITLVAEGTRHKLDISSYILNLIKILLQVDDIKNSEAAVNPDMYLPGAADNTRGYSSGQ